VIAPSRFHHLFLEAAAARYPRADVWLAPELAERLPALRAAGTLGDDTPPPLRDHLTAVHVAGAPRIAETVFFHAASRTLLCTDLIFHVTRPANLRTRMILGLAGTGGRLAVSRDWGLMTRDRAARDASIARILDWDIGRIVMGHGDVFEGDGNMALRVSRLAPRG